MVRFFAVLGTILLGLACSGLALSEEISGKLETIAVERGELLETLVLDGVIEAVQQSTVSAQVTLADGRVLETGDMTFYPYANPATHTFRLRMRLSEPNGSLFPGMLVKVGVPVATRDALWIPASGLVRRSELRAVFVLDDQGRPRLRQIRTGSEQEDRLEVLAGLSEGEKVVVHPGELVGSDRLNLSAGSVSGEKAGKEVGN